MSSSLASHSQSQERTSSGLWVVSCYFNPERYHTKRRNLDLFRQNLERQHVQYTIVECAFRGAPFELPLDPKVLRIRANDVMWQKERLLNCAIETIPIGVTKVAWLDCDILFEDDLWHVRAATALDVCSVIQPYSESVRLGPSETPGDSAGPVSASFAWKSLTVPPEQRAHYKDHGRTGFAWAGRREWLNACGLYDACVMGGADHFMAHIFDLRPDSPCLRNFWSGRKHFKKHFDKWANSVASAIRYGGLGAVQGRVYHLWHGDRIDRYYRSRQKILRQMKFDPSVDLRISLSGAWSWSSEKHELHKAAERYYRLRQEDGSSPLTSVASLRRWRRRDCTVYTSTSTSRAPSVSSLPATAQRVDSSLLSNCTIYEWYAWDGYMLPRIFPNGHRLQAKPLESLEGILERIPSSTLLFVFHLNFTNVHHFPLCRAQLCSELSRRGVRLLNAHVVDTSKRAIQSVCRTVGLRLLETTSLAGAPNDVVIVKTNQNYGGFGEKQLSATESRALGLSSPCPLGGRWDYRIVHRDNVPTSWWNDPSLIVEDYVSNSTGLKYRSYFAGDNHILFATVGDHMIMRLSTNKLRQITYATRTELQSGSVHGYPVSLQLALINMIDYMKLDFGAIDFLEDDVGNTYVLDINTTTYAHALTCQSIEYLRLGLLEYLDTSRIKQSRLRMSFAIK